MIQRIAHIEPLKEHCLSVLFDDGRHVIYDVEEDIQQLPGYSLLGQVTGLFRQVQLDQSRTCVYWTKDIDLPSHAIYEYGTPII